jgi:glycine betaine/proline transport system permease protein
MQIVPPLSWIAVVRRSSALLGLYAGGRRLAVLVAACFGCSSPCSANGRAR